MAGAASMAGADAFVSLPLMDIPTLTCRPARLVARSEAECLVVEGRQAE